MYDSFSMVESALPHENGVLVEEMNRMGHVSYVLCAFCLRIGPSGGQPIEKLLDCSSTATSLLVPRLNRAPRRVEPLWEFRRRQSALQCWDAFQSRTCRILRRLGEPTLLSTLISSRKRVSSVKAFFIFLIATLVFESLCCPSHTVA